MQVGALWCKVFNLVQHGALWRKVVQVGVGWRSKVQFSSSWFSLAQFGAVLVHSYAGFYTLVKAGGIW